MIDPGLTGKTVLITGANNPHGIGAATAKAFAAQGANVFLHYFRLRRDSAPTAGAVPAVESPGAAFYWSQLEKNAEEVLAGVRALGARAFAWEGDLSDPATIPSMFDEAERSLGPVEVLVNNAAYWEADTLLPAAADLENKLVELWEDRPSTITASAFDRLFSVNTRAVALAMAEFARRHIQRGARWGRIINVSTDGADCFPSEASYGASKFALESYTRSAAAELGKLGITVNVLSLGPVQTGWVTPELEETILPSIPLRRIGVPSDVAMAVVFFASQQAGWITGQKIYVGGGHAM
ncbi:MAG TPA: SDR family oxidoreductase [Bryobacteraceae bacterium]|nr:SDR family oxidoreductase [Bryobacteraceae bacterium]